MATETNQLKTILTLQDNMSAKLGAIEARLKGLGTTAGVAGRTGAMAAEQWGSKLKTLGGNLRMLGMTMTTYVTAPLVGLGYVAVKTAMDMESKWAEVRKVYDGAASDIKNLLEPAVNKLSVSMGFNRTQTLDALAAIAAMGYIGKPAIDMLTQSMKFARLGNMDLGQSMEAVVAVSKIYNVSGKKLTAMLAIMNETENVSAASMDDLTWGIREAASVGRLAGVDIRELSAMMAVLRERAIPAGEAAFSLKSIFTRLRNPTKDAKMILDEFNIAISDTKGRVMDADQILLKIAGSWKKMTERQQESLAKDLVGIHQKGRFISLIDDMTRKNSTYNSVLKKTADETTNLNHYQKELNIFLEQAKVKWEAIKTQLGVVAEKIGKRLLPVVLDLGQKAAVLATKFAALPIPVQDTILKFAAFVATAGPVLMFLGGITSAIGSLVSAVHTLSGALIFLNAHPIVAAITAIIAVVMGALAVFRPLSDALVGLDTKFRGLRAAVMFMINPLLGAMQAWNDLLDSLAEFGWISSDTANRLSILKGETVKETSALNALTFAMQRSKDAARTMKDEVANLKLQQIAVTRAEWDRNNKLAALNTAIRQHGTNSRQAKVASLDYKEAEARLTLEESRLEGQTKKTKSAIAGSKRQKELAKVAADQLTGGLGALRTVSPGVAEAIGKIASSARGLKGDAEKAGSAAASIGARAKASLQRYYAPINNMLEKIGISMRKNLDPAARSSPSALDRLKAGLEKAIKILERFIQRVKDKLGRLRDSLGNVFSALGSKIDVVFEGKKLREAITAAEAKVAAAKTPEEKEAAEAELVEARKAYADWQKQVEDDLKKEQFQRELDAIQAQVAAGKLTEAQAEKKIKDLMKKYGLTEDDIKAIGGSFQSVFDNLINRIGDLADAIKAAIKKIHAAEKKESKKEKQLAKAKKKKKKKKHHGGYVNIPSWAEEEYILAGGERVVSRTGADMVKGGDVNINFNGSISIRKDSDITAIADAVAKALGRRATLASYGAF